MTTLIHKLMSLGDKPSDSDEERQRHHYLIAMALLMSCGGIVWGSMSLSFNLTTQATIPLGYTCITCINMLWFMRDAVFDNTALLACDYGVLG